MNKVKLEISSDQLNKLLLSMKSLSFNKQNFPATAAATTKGINRIRNIWTSYLAGDTELEGIGKIKKPIDPSKINFTYREAGDFNKYLSTDSPKVIEVENGRKTVDYDMKKTHPYGPKSRITKYGKNKGTPYLIVNFRWGTPNKNNEKRAHFNNFIPQDQFNTSVKALQLMYITGNQHVEENFKGDEVLRDEYVNEKGENKWSYIKEHEARYFTNKNGKKFSNAGLVHMASGEYFTFRVISAASPAESWLYHREGIPGVPMMEALKKTVQKDIEALIYQGLIDDILKYEKS